MAVWCEERRFLAQNCMEDWYFSENSSSYPVQRKQVEALASTHTVKHITVCPTQLGLPIRRKRTFSFGIDKARWVWLGGDTPTEVQREFEEVFAASLQLPGDVYLQATEEAVFDRRRSSLPPNFKRLPMQDYLTCLLPPGGMALPSMRR